LRALNPFNDRGLRHEPRRAAKRARRIETTAPEALDDFDEVVQQRFHNVIGFGMTRVATQRWFLPETKQEKDSVKALQKSGYEICLFMVGRSILQDIPDRLRRSQTYFGGLGLHLMSGPVFVGKSTLKGLPGDREMWEPARKALRKFDDGATRHSFEEAGWTIEARPVRASDNQCLDCHGYDVEFKFDANGPGYSFGRAAVRNKRRGRSDGAAVRLSKTERSRMAYQVIASGHDIKLQKDAPRFINGFRKERTMKLKLLALFVTVLRGDNAGYSDSRADTAANRDQARRAAVLERNFSPAEGSRSLCPFLSQSDTGLVLVAA
jgi:hypothetical protein